MNQDNNLINTSTVQKEEKEFLAREEIKTMSKDVAKLRETEALRERSRIGKIKTEEELAREKERERLAAKAALERDLAEKEAREKEEKIRKMREESSIAGQAVIESNIEKTNALAGELKNTLKETQSQEEELRKKFLARIEARAEGKEESPAIAPTISLIPPSVKEEKAPDASKAFFKKANFKHKIWIRIILSLFLASILALIITFLYWYFHVRKAPAVIEKTTPVVTEEKELIVPPSLLDIENSQTLPIAQASEIPALLSQALKSTSTLDSMQRILFKDTAKTEILGLKALFDSLSVAPPDGFYDKISDNATLFTYTQEEGNRLGLVMKINDQEGLTDMMKSWEGSMEQDFSELFALLGKDQPALVSYFKDTTYQGTSVRFQTFNRQDLGIVYTINDDYLILTSSWKSMKKTLDKLKEAPVSRFFSPGSGAEFVLADMSLEQKIGQLFFIGINGTTLTEKTEKLIASIQPGGILLLKKNLVNEAQVKKLVQDLQQVAFKNYGVPLFIGVDQEGGTISPLSFIQEKTAQSEIQTADQAYAVGLSRGEELKNLGINLNLAPVLDTAQSGDFLFDRAFPETGSAIYALVKALILGQKTASILTAIKHFPGYGDIAFDPEDKLAVLNETPKVDLFKTAAEAKPEFVMTSNVIYTDIDPDLPFSFSEKGVKLIQQSVGSEPLIMTDDLPQQSLIDRFSLKGVVTLPIKAGANILTFSNNWETTLPESVRILKEAVQDGEISQKQINDSVLKIIKLKKAYYNE